MKKTITSGGVVIKAIDGLIKIALARDPAQGENSWVLPKGHIRQGETLETAAVREIREEVGIENPQLIHYLGYFTRLSVEDWGETVEKDIHLYLAYAFGAIEVKPADFETVVETGWFSLDECIKLVSHREDAEFLCVNLAPLLEIPLNQVITEEIPDNDNGTDCGVQTSHRTVYEK